MIQFWAPTRSVFARTRSTTSRWTAAIYRIVLYRMRWDPPTRAYVTRRTSEGLSKKEIIRCLKRYIVREIYPDLLRTPA